MKKLMSLALALLIALGDYRSPLWRKTTEKT